MKLSKQEQVIFDLLKEKPRTAREIIYYGNSNYPSSKIRDLRNKGIVLAMFRLGIGITNLSNYTK